MHAGGRAETRARSATDRTGAPLLLRTPAQPREARGGRAGADAHGSVCSVCRRLAGALAQGKSGARGQAKPQSSHAGPFCPCIGWRRTMHELFSALPFLLLTCLLSLSDCVSLSHSVPPSRTHSHSPAISLSCVSLSHSLPPSRTHSRSFLLCLSQTARPPPRSLLLSRSLSLSPSRCVCVAISSPSLSLSLALSLARSLSLSLVALTVNTCPVNIRRGFYLVCFIFSWPTGEQGL